MKVAIVCGHPDTQFLAPYNDLEWEIWVLGNRCNLHLDKRVTRIFEIHDYTDMPEPEKYKKWLVSHNIPLVVGEKFGIEAPNVEVFDYNKSAELFGSVYLTSSPAYMMSYAISAGATEIGIYGVNLSIDDYEYFWQRPCMEAWIGFARGRGIKVTIPEQSHIGKCSYSEGRDWNAQPDKDSGPFTAANFLELANDHQAKIDECRAQQNELELKISAHTGSYQVYERLAKAARAVEAKVMVNSLSQIAKVK